MPRIWSRRGLPRLVAVAAGTAAVGALALTGPSAAGITPFAYQVPDSALAATDATVPACTSPSPTISYAWIHCDTPPDMRAAFDVPDNYKGDGQTIVLVDSYGSPTAAADLQKMHDAFFPNEPEPDFQEVYAGSPQTFADANCGADGVSGPSAAANWAGEADLDIEWAYSVAPHAHIVLLAVNPAETLGVQGFPTMFRAISDAIDTYPAGTVFSLSLGVGEETFGGAAQVQTDRFDAVFRKGLANGDTFVSAAGDYGSTEVSKLHRETVNFDHPEVSWPNTSPYVTSVGGTELMYGWLWDPTSDVPFTADGNYNPAYWNYIDGPSSEAVWNESWAGIATGGGVSTIYPRPSYQDGVLPQYGNHRLVPDLSFPASANGGALVYTSFFPACNRVGWHIYAGTSAASPQIAGLVSLANQARREAGKSPVGNLNERIYRIGPTGHSADFADWNTPFRDIVPRQYGTVASGDLSSNQLFGSDIPGYPTTAGYDLTTGWGSPRGTAFVDALLAQN